MYKHKAFNIHTSDTKTPKLDNGNSYNGRMDYDNDIKLIQWLNDDVDNVKFLQWQDGLWRHKTYTMAVW